MNTKKKKVNPAKKPAKKREAKKAIQVQTDESLQIAINCLLSGNNSDEVARVVLKYRKENKMPTRDIPNIVEKAVQFLHDEYSKDENHVKALHVRRYDERITDALQKDNKFQRILEMQFDIEHGKEYADMSPEEKAELVGIRTFEIMDGLNGKALSAYKTSLTNTYFNALSTMYAKEKVLQMHSKSFQVHIFNKLNVEVQAPTQQYDLSKLTLDEKIDFLNLVLKSKKNEFEIGSVILRTDKQQQETVDIDYEEVQETPNIEKIEHEKQPERPPLKDGNALMNATDKLKIALQKKAEEEFRKAGAKI